MNNLLLAQTSVKNQGDNDWCTGCAVATAVEVLTGVEHSEAFVVYCVDWMRRDSTLESACLAAYAVGICRQGQFVPPIISNGNFVEAKKYRVSPSVRVRGDEEIVMAMEMGMPVVVSLPVGIIKSLGLMVPSRAQAEFHCVCCVGVRDGNLVLRNSWGRDWNDGGDFEVPSVLAQKFRAAYALSLA